MLPCQRHLFNIPDDITFLNIANYAPQLKSVTEAGLAAVRKKESPWLFTSNDWFDLAEEWRRLSAQFMGVDVDGVALIPSASYGIAIAAANIPLKRGQTIVLLHQEFPSNVYAWIELAQQNGAQVIFAQRESGESWTDALLRNIDARTALVAAPQCHWTDGSRVDLIPVSKKAREVGAALVLDVSQSLGASVIDIAKIQPDFLVSVGYKWMLGPYSLAYMYVAPKWHDGKPIEYSWLTREGAEDFTKLVDYTEGFRPGARRFDMGEYSQFVNAPMAIAALQQLIAWTPAVIEQTIGAHTQRIADEAIRLGFNLFPPDQRSKHMIGIRRPGGIPAALPKALADEKVFVSVRGDSIRIAPHVYVADTDLDRLFSVLRRFA
jgi:selenocysteine lyase/cysteine desulfurase